MSETFIKEIEIKQYKCFKNFNAEGFSRVNLIGGKNNVGKTAFMEALYLFSNVLIYLTNTPDYKKNEISEYINKNREELNFKIFELLTSIEKMRNRSSFLLQWIREEFDLSKISEFNIKQGNIELINDDGFISLHQLNKNWNYGVENLFTFRENKYFSKIFKKNNLPMFENKTFVSFCNDLDANVIDELKLNGKYEYMNSMLKDIFSLGSIDNIKNQLMIKDEGRYQSLNSFGDGLKNFIYMAITILSHKDKVIYIDEIENGIHYTKLDEMWRLILKLSKENNVQVFATTHSKECIESYARVAKELEEKDISFINLTKLKNNDIVAGVRNYETFQYTIDDGNEVRGW